MIVSNSSSAEETSEELASQDISVSMLAFMLCTYWSMLLLDILESGDSRSPLLRTFGGCEFYDKIGVDHQGQKRTLIKFIYKNSITV